MLHTWKAFAGGVWPAKKKILAARARNASENNRARKCTRQNVFELAHVSLFAGYRDLEAATTVEPVLSGTVLSGHPLLSGQFSKSRNYFSWCTVISTPIKRSRSPLRSPNRTFCIVVTCIKRSHGVHTVSNNVTHEVQQLISLFVFANH